jgi:hypothetical protein
MPQPVQVREERSRLSESVLFKLERGFFSAHGPRAWLDGGVPEHITTQPLLARAYARVIQAYVEDLCRAAKARRRGSAPVLDRSQAIHLIEVGAGSGRFAFQLLAELEEQGGLAEGLQLRYVATDLVEANLRALAANPQLQPLIKEGRLDFAVLDLAAPRTLKLLVSAETLSARRLGNPLIVVANYVFCSLPQDLFFAGEEGLREGLVTVTGELPSTQAPLDALQIDFIEGAPAPRAPYRERDLDAALRASPVRGGFLFPAGALRSLSYFRKLGRGRVCALVADKGHRDQPLTVQPPRPAFHGCFSFPVDFDAVGRYVQRAGGETLRTHHHHGALQIEAYVWGGPDPLVETRRSFEHNIEQSCPDDFYAVRQALEPRLAELTLAQGLALLRLAGPDARLFGHVAESLLAQVDDATRAQRSDLMVLLRALYARHLHAGEDFDLPFTIGLFFWRMAEWTEARTFFERSIERHGPSATAWFNLGMCDYRLGDLEPALQSVERAVTLDPTFAPATAARQHIEADLASRRG